MPIRPDEVDGRDYHFLTPEEFEARVSAGEFLEHVTYAGNRYGTLRAEVDRIIAARRWPLVEIELAGARAVRASEPGAVAVFIAPPSLSELERRLERRGTDSEGAIAQRLATSRVELEAMNEFDYVIVNEEVGAAIEELARVIATATGRGPHG